MIFSIDADRRRPIYVQIMDEVRRGRVLGTLRPGDPLPSVRQLAGELGVNPNTVKQAYRELEREGIPIAHVDVGGGFGIRYRDETPPDVRGWCRGLVRRFEGTPYEVLLDGVGNSSARYESNFDNAPRVTVQAGVFPDGSNPKVVQMFRVQ